jgi:hypothetical protein
MNFAQICGALGDFNLGWPDRVGGFLDILGTLDFDVDAIGPNCVFTGWGWQHDMYLQLLLPVVVLVANKGQYFAAKLLLTMRLPRFRVLKWLGIAPANREELSDLHDELNMKVISFVNMVYLTLVRYCVGAFVCDEVAVDKAALVASPPMDCWTSEHQTVVGFAAIGMLVYVVGFPLFVATTLMRVHNAQQHSDPKILRKYGEIYDRYETDGFAYEMMSITRRGVFGIISVFKGSPEMQCFASQLVLILQFTAQVPPTRCSTLSWCQLVCCSRFEAFPWYRQVKLNPYIDANLDIVETVLTLILLFLACCGLIFSAYSPASGLELSSWKQAQLLSLTWLSYLSMILGSLLCAALLANEFFELLVAWYLNRVSFLGDASADPEQGKGKLTYSKSALAYPEARGLEADPRSLSSKWKGALVASAAIQKLKSVARRRLSVVGSYNVPQGGADKVVSSRDTKLFYLVNLLRFRKSMQGLDPSERPS